MIVMDRSKILAEVNIDNLHFSITSGSQGEDSCILWFMDTNVKPCFEALGLFASFQKRAVLEFIVRYASSPELRSAIDIRRFERRIEQWTPTYLAQVERLYNQNKIMAFRCLFGNDTATHESTLAAKRRIMARKFHPDAGGNNRAMSLINEAYAYFREQAGA